MKTLMCSLAALLSVALDSGNVVAAEDGFQKAANIFIGTVVSENSRYITVTRGSDHWRFRTVLSRETQIETSRTLANTSKMFIHTTQRTAVTKLRIAKVTSVTNEAAPFPQRPLS